MKKLLIITSSLLIAGAAADAGILHRVTATRQFESNEREVAETFAARHRLYIAANFVESFTIGEIAAPYKFDGRATSSFDAAFGVRITDIFRTEFNYHRAAIKYNAFDLNGDMFFVNGIFDARIKSKYLLGMRQFFVPYVGLGLGAANMKSDTANVTTKKGTDFTAAALAGVALEFNPRFALDAGYRYLYLASPGITVTATATNISPSAHQWRIGARVNF
ncbi:MAG: porin family protein [Alphaproteobacteria bacterium]|nr:porin family protein [Alphaproteobacteria bacterium]MCL2889758.1 porin family protein [Alphaproteobacteria bacterium]